MEHLTPKEAAKFLHDNPKAFYIRNHKHFIYTRKIGLFILKLFFECHFK